MEKSGGIFANKKTLAYILIAIAVVVLVLGLILDQALFGLLAGAAFLVVGIFFYRRARK